MALLNRGKGSPTKLKAKGGEVSNDLKFKQSSKLSLAQPVSIEPAVQASQTVQTIKSNQFVQPTSPPRDNSNSYSSTSSGGTIVAGESRPGSFEENKTTLYIQNNNSRPFTVQDSGIAPPPAVPTAGSNITISASTVTTGADITAANIRGSSIPRLKSSASLRILSEIKAKHQVYSNSLPTTPSLTSPALRPVSKAPHIPLGLNPLNSLSQPLTTAAVNNSAATATTMSHHSDQSQQPSAPFPLEDESLERLSKKPKLSDGSETTKAADTAIDEIADSEDNPVGIIDNSANGDEKDIAVGSQKRSWWFWSAETAPIESEVSTALNETNPCYVSTEVSSEPSNLSSATTAAAVDIKQPGVSLEQDWPVDEQSEKLPSNSWLGSFFFNPLAKRGDANPSSEKKNDTPLTLNEAAADDNNTNKKISQSSDSADKVSSLEEPSTLPDVTNKTPQGSAEPSDNRTWAFWSKQPPKNKNIVPQQQDEGEVAIIGTESQNHPKKVLNPPATVPSEEEVVDEVNGKIDPKGQKIIPIEDQKTTTQSKKGSSKKDAGRKESIAKIRRPNLVLPPINLTFEVYSHKRRLASSLRRLSAYFAPQTRHYVDEQSHQHLFRSSPKKIHKVVVIGVHGYFPVRMIRPFVGEPTGTSVKFANDAANAVQKWAEEKGYEVDIEKIALEGEGKVLHRVENLYKLLHNWMDHIHACDFVFFAAHSQGTPVAAHLMARLVEEGDVEGKQLALLGMAGISLGPFYGLDQRLLIRAYSSLEGAALSELFEFQDPQSLQSRKYIESLRTIIAQNAKIVFVGSMNDQLVPLYSAECIHISHPNIYRAVYVDGEDVAPEFVSTLISLALRLRNNGSTDHNILKEISGSLSGTLTGKGHSKMYDEPLVYEMAVRHALETTDLLKVPIKVDEGFEIPKANHNPYLLPWSMRGLLSELLSRPTYQDQLEELYAEFDQWHPESKTLKDIKYRLNAITAKL